MANPSSNHTLDEYTKSYYDNAKKFSPTMAMVIILLLAGCFMLAFMSLVVRRCIRERAADALARSPGGSPAQSSGSYPVKLTRGLEKADVEALPLVHGADLGEKDDHECPVCLADFADEDTLRLLPACKHVFHQECIDAWFDSHSTCPLCRASLVGSQDSSTVPEATPVHVHVHDEDDDSDAEVHGGARHGASSRRVFTGSRRMVSREGSVRVRNAEFESALHESAGADKELSFRKPSSLSADLVSLRNLLMGANQSRVASFRRSKPESNHETSYLSTQDEWVTIDLETGKAAEPASTSSTTSPGPAAALERSWSDRFSFSRIKSLKGMAMLSRSTSDLSSRHTSHLPL